MNTIARLRETLVPGGTLPVVHIQMNDPFVDYSFIQSCIDELEKIPARAAVGDKPSNLEKLAYALLCDSAFIERG